MPRTGEKILFSRTEPIRPSVSPAPLIIIRKLLNGDGMLTDNKSMFHLVAQLLQVAEMGDLEAGL